MGLVPSHLLCTPNREQGHSSHNSIRPLSPVFYSRVGILHDIVVIIGSQYIVRERTFTTTEMMCRDLKDIKNLSFMVCSFGFVVVLFLLELLTFV